MDYLSLEARAAHIKESRKEERREERRGSLNKAPAYLLSLEQDSW